MKLVSDQVSQREIAIILRELRAVLSKKIPGDVVEFGCYVGTTSLFLQTELKNADNSRALHVYDSFQGLPQKTVQDLSPAGEQFKPGELLAVKRQLINNFKHAGLPLPFIHKGWFSELSTDQVPSTIAFAFLDGDYYQSILEPLKLIWPKLTSGSIVVVDDYQNEQLPGVKKAIDTWAHHHSFQLKSEASLALISVQ